MNITNRKIPLFKVGDKYIRISQYGGITTGEIVRIVPTKVIHLTKGNNSQKFVYTKYSIVNENGIVYDIGGSDGCFYKIENEINI